MEPFQEFRNTDTDIEKNWSFFMIKQQHYTLKRDEDGGKQVEYDLFNIIYQCC